MMSWGRGCLLGASFASSSNASLHNMVAVSSVMRQLLVFRELRLQRETLNPAVTFMGGWGSVSPMRGWSDLPSVYFCTMDAEELCAAANAQGLRPAPAPCTHQRHSSSLGQMRQNDAELSNLCERRVHAQ